MKITLVRHAETMFNENNKIQGTSNIKLSDKGVRNVLKLRDKINDNHYDICFMSPLSRCVETAFLLVGDRILTQVDERLLERGMGNLEGKDFSCYDKYKYWNYDINSSEEEVESVKELIDRARLFLDSIKKEYKDKSVLVVSHSAMIRAIILLINKVPLEGELYDKCEKIPNCYIGEFEI